MMLKSRLNFPPGGFTFYQAETGWQAPQWLTFDATVQNIIIHRRANSRFAHLSIDPGVVANELDAYNAARLKDLPGGAAYITQGDGPPSFRTPRLPRQSPRVVAAEGVRKTMAGVGTILSWLGDGLEPVAQETANARAEICVGCDRNTRSEGIHRALNTVGDILHSIAQAKAQMKLATPSDEKLESCAACGCVLQTKVWVPAEHIKKGITPEVESKLSPQCWIRPLLSS